MSIIGKVFKTVLTIAETPVAIVKDVATLGGAITDQNEPYSIKKLREVGENYEELKDEL